MPEPHGRVLTIAGSDPSAGAGLQADLKMISALGGIGFCAVTAVTVQDTAQVYGVTPMDPELVKAQIRAVLEDMGADTIKLGMLADAAIVRALADLLSQWPQIPVIADPVLAGTGGGRLLDGDGRRLFMERLLPCITLLTPNLPEAAALAGLDIEDETDLERAARTLCGPGRAQAVLITGGHGKGETLTDLLYDGHAYQRFSGPRIPTSRGFHGTGCALASAIATRIAQGAPLPQAVRDARFTLQQAMKQTLTPGKGQRLLHPFQHHAPPATL